MSFINKLSSTIQKERSRLKVISVRRQKTADARARAKLATARTKIKREKTKTQQAREKLTLKRELYEERLATKREHEAMIRARREAGIITTGERLDKAGRKLGKQAGSALGALFRATNKATRKSRPRGPIRTKDGKYTRRRE